MKQLISISLAAIFMLSTLGFQVSSHFCGGHLMESQVSLGAEELTCGMEEMAALCEKPRKAKKCCTNEHQSLEVQDDYQLADYDWSAQIDLSILYTLPTSELIIAQQIEEITFFSDTSPPPLLEELYLHNQSFLI